MLAEHLWDAWTVSRGTHHRDCAPLSPEPPRSLPDVVDSIATSASRCDGSHVLIVDDVHVIGGVALIQELADVIDERPRSLAIVLVSREDPPLPWLTLRANGELVELRAADLAFDTSETRAMLASGDDTSIPDSAVERLAQTSGGWAVAIRLAAIEASTSDDPAATLDLGIAENRYLERFFNDEVLGSVDAGSLDFLERVSTLDTLTASLCAAVTGRFDSYARLNEAVSSGLFTDAIPSHGEAHFVFHPLMRGALRRRFRSTDPVGFRQALLRARDWCREQGQWSDAVGYAARAEDWDSCAELIKAGSGPMMAAGRTVTVSEWLGVLPERTIQGDLQLCLLDALTSQILFQQGRYAIAIRNADRLFGTIPAETSRGAVVVRSWLQANDFLVRGYLDALVAPLEQASSLARAGRADEIMQGFGIDDLAVDSALASACLFAGRFAEARRVAQRAMGHGARGGHAARIRVRGAASLAAAWSGDIASARLLVAEALELLEDEPLDSNDPFLVHLTVAWVGIPGVPRRSSMTYVMDLANRSGVLAFSALAALASARIALDAGSPAVAERARDKAHDAIGEVPEPGVLASLAQRVDSDLIAYRADHAQPTISERERQVLVELTTGATRREVAERLGLSLDTVKTYLARAYRNLGVGGKEDALARAGELGIL